MRDQAETRWRVDDEAGLLACYDATVAAAHRYAHRLTGSRARSEDVVQDVYLQLVRAARDGRVVEVGAGWIMLAVRHRVLDQVRAADREERRLRLVWSSHADASASSDLGSLDGVELSGRERAALTLRYVDDLTVAEIADALGTSVRATESLLARARARVRKAGA
ncbi:MAG: RNA polymerase sigma factor [Desertimonas sp.]